MRKVLLAVFIFCFTWAISPVPGVSATEVPVASIKIDSSRLLVRKLDEQKLNAYRRDRAFKYSNTTPDNFWEKLWNWFWQWINSLMSGRVSGGIIKYGAIGLLLALAIFGITRFFGLDMRFILGKSKALPLSSSEMLENIHEIDFNNDIELAITNGNYRLAVRLYYLKTLKRLNDQSIIKWQPEKTNHTYITEIENPEMQQQFTLLTNQFEYIWYGEFFIDQENFKGVKNSFEQFNSANR